MNKTTTSNFYNKSKQLPPVKTEKPDPSIIKLSDEKKYIALNRQDFNNSIIQKWGEIIISKLPVRRTNHISFIYNNYFYIFGGRDINETKMNDMYRVKLDFSEESCEKWEKISYDGDITPECVAGHKAVLINKYLYVFGGVNITEDANNKIYIFDVEKRKWSKKVFRENQIIPLSAHSMSLVGKLIVIVGGYSKGKFNEKTFLYDYENNIWDSYPREMTPEEIEEENRRLEEEERRQREEEEERKRKEEEERNKKEEEERNKFEELERSRREEEERRKKEEQEKMNSSNFQSQYFEYKEGVERDDKTKNMNGNENTKDEKLDDLISDNIKKDIIKDNDNAKNDVEQEINDNKILNDKEKEKKEQQKKDETKTSEEPQKKGEEKTGEVPQKKEEINKEDKPKKKEEDKKKTSEKQKENKKEKEKIEEEEQPKKKEETKKKKYYFCRKPKIPEPTPDEVPEPRINQSQVTTSNKLLYIYGGINSEGHYLNDMWSFSISEYYWSKIEIQGEIPSPRSGHSCLIQGNNLYIFGGKIANIFEVNEFWKFDIKTNRFTLIHDTLLEMGNNEGKSVSKTKEKTVEYHDPYHTFYKLKKMNMPNKTANDFYNNNKNNVHQNKYEDLVMKDYKAKIMKNSLIYRIEPDDQVFIKKLNQANQDIKLDKIRYGIVPVPRDGHSSFMFDNKMYVFGGDRNKFPFNDMFVYDFNREVKQKENVDDNNIDKDSRNKAVNVNEDKKSQISSKSKTSKNTSSRRK